VPYFFQYYKSVQVTAAFLETSIHLINTLEWRDGLALVLVKGSMDNITVLQLHVG